MSQHMRSGGTFVGPGWSLQADQALQPLEGEFNPPSQAIESKNISGRKVFRLERGYQNHPICGVERLLRELVASLLCAPARLAPRSGSSLRRLLDRNQTQGERRAALAFYPDRSVDQAAG